MLLVTSNKTKQLLYLSFIGTVRPEEFQNRREELANQLAGLSPGFHSLVDLTHLEFLGLECMAELGRQMELIGKSGVSLVVRVIPDPSKDIDVSDMMPFVYKPEDQKKKEAAVHAID